MRFAANAAELAGVLAQAELALDARIVIAILGGIHIQASADGTVRLTVNALDRVISVTVTAEVAEAGETVVRATALAGLASGLRQGQHGRDQRRRARRTNPLWPRNLQASGHADRPAAAGAGGRRRDRRDRARPRGAAGGGQEA